MDYLRGGSRLWVDCVKQVHNKYGLGHISEGLERDRWVDITELVLPSGTPPYEALTKLPKLDVCQ